MHLNELMHFKNNLFYGLYFNLIHDHRSQGLKNLIGSQQLKE